MTPFLRAFVPAGAKVAPDRGAADPPSAARGGFASADLDAVLGEYHRLLDIDRDDLEAILRQAEIRADRHRAGRADVASIMSRDVTDALLADAVRLMATSGLHHLPVAEPDGRPATARRPGLSARRFRAR